MASNNAVTSNSDMSVKNENDAEINAMALKLKDSYRKNALAAVKQVSAFPVKVYSNTANRTVTSAIKPITTNNTQKNNQELIKNYKDVESRKARFAWESIAGFCVPYIVRLINGEHLKFISTRMAEKHLLSNYLHYLHSDIYLSCTSVKCHFITDSEAKLLNDINYNHTDCVYGKEMFLAGKDAIAHLEHVQAFYTFIEVCYKKLLCNITPNHNEICGFIRINSESVVPYCIKDSHKYVPLFYFEGETENLINQALKLENWDLSYLKFCCKVQGIRNELFSSDSCLVARLDVIKNYFPSNTNFEDYWPAKVVNIHLLTNQKPVHFSPPGAWFKASPEVELAENSNPITAPALNIPQSMSVINTYNNGWPANQMVNSYSTQAQMPSTTYGYSNATRNQSMTAQYYNKGSIMFQDNSWMNSYGHGVPPPTQVLAGSTTQVIGNTVSYSNIPIGQCMTTGYHPMTNSNVMSHSNQIRQIYNQRANNNIQAQQQIQQQLQQKHLITTPQVQQLYSGQPVYGRVINNQQRNILRNVRPVITPATEVIDLSTPPTSPVPETPLHTDVRWELTKIPERMWPHHTSHSAAYKILQTSLQGKLIYCINTKPYIYADLMVTLADLVQTMLLPCNVAKCAHVLNKYLKTTLFSGNSEQLAVLRDSGRHRSIYPEDTPMAKIEDVAQVILQLRTLVSKDDEQIQQLCQYVGVSSKRQRTN